MPVIHSCDITRDPLEKSCFRSAAQFFCVLFVIWLMRALPAAAQSCPAPWAKAANVYGMVTLDGTGTGSSGEFMQSVNQHAVAAGKLVSLGACVWQAIPNVGFGQMRTQASINDSFTDTANGNFCKWSASGTGDPLWDDLTLQILPTVSQYNVAAFGAVPGKFTINQGSTNEDIIWGSMFGDGGVSEQQIPFPPSAALLYASHSYQLPPFENAQCNPEIINANWQANWLFTPVPDGTCKDCDDLRGSQVSIRNQSLGEDIDIVGTPFSLHYESQRAAGRAGADLFAIKDALSLGGWTLSAHHVFEPLLLSYCAGGSCTPYSIVPKALYLGDGAVRTSAEVQAPLVVASNFELTSEDGSEIYVFDSASGRHLQTLLPMTGGVLYNFGYDPNGLLISVTDGSGNVTTIQRDSKSHPTAIVSPYGRTTSLSVDANGYLSQVIDPMGHAIKLATSTLGLLSSFRDANGNLYSFQYDSNGFLTTDSDPAGGALKLTLANSASGYSVAETTTQGRVNSNSVAFSNTSSSTTQQFVNTWTNGLQANETDVQQNGQLTRSVALPNGSSYGMTLGPDPRWGVQMPIVSSETVQRGSLTMNISRTRTVALANPSDPFSLTTQTDTETINGVKSTSAFTAATRTYVDKTPQSRITTTVLDELERITTLQPTGLSLTNFAYDSRGRLASLTDGTRTTTFAYDANGNLSTVTDPLNLTRSFTYDLDGRLLTSTLEDGRVVSYSYDANGNLTSITPPGSLAHAFGYSTVNQLTSYTPPPVSGGGATTYSFNSDREITKMTRPDGQVINYSYDPSGRIISLNSPGTTLNFGYDSTSGNLSTASVSGGETITYSYDGSLPTGSAWTGEVAGAVGRSFNNNFWVTSETINGANSVSFTFDKDGLVTKAGAITVKHDAKTGLYTGGTLGKAIDTIAHSIYAEPTTHTAKFGTSVLYKVTYTRDDNGRITSLTDTIGGTATTYTYTYDPASRLTEVDSGTAKKKVVLTRYRYDSNSNRVSVTTPSGTVNATYDVQDRLLTYGNTAYTYSANGEVATKSVGSQVTTYQYDVLGNLTEATLPEGTQITYIMDAAHRRVGKKINGALVAGYLYDGNNLVAQLNASNQIVIQFVYGSGAISPDYMISGGVTYRLFSDHRGSPRLVVDSSTGVIFQRIDYDEFGDVVNDTNPGFQPFGFAGGLYDQNTKLVHFGARDYDASIGRWIAKDPISFSGGDSNLYGYVLNDPVNMVDPAGLEGDCICQKAWWNFVNGFVDKGTDLILTPVMPVVAIGQMLTGAHSPTELGRVLSGTTNTVNTSSQAYSNGQTTAEVAGNIASVVAGGPVAANEGKAIGSKVGQAISNARIKNANVAFQRELASARRQLCNAGKAVETEMQVVKTGQRGTVIKGTRGSGNGSGPTNIYF
jgi:RHS repeat-associated protein